MTAHERYNATFQCRKGRRFHAAKSGCVIYGEYEDLKRDSSDGIVQKS
jgi:hypothetical protein